MSESEEKGRISGSNEKGQIPESEVRFRCGMWVSALGGVALRYDIVENLNQILIEQTLKYRRRRSFDEPVFSRLDLKFVGISRCL